MDRGSKAAWGHPRETVAALMKSQAHSQPAAPPVNSESVPPPVKSREDSIAAGCRNWHAQFSKVSAHPNLCANRVD